MVLTKHQAEKLNLARYFLYQDDPEGDFHEGQMVQADRLIEIIEMLLDNGFKE